MATIHDVARLAGVSVATVSRVLNGNYPVSEEKRKQVQKAVRELNFKPNILGRNLGRVVNRTILVVTSATSGMLFTETIEGINEAANAAGFDMLIAYLPYGADRPQSTSWNKCVEYLEGGLAGGVILLGLAAIQALSNSDLGQIPVVQCSETVLDYFPNSVTYDNRAASAQLTRHLIAQGYRRFGFVLCRKPYEQEPSRFSLEREEGLRQALAEAGLPAHPEWNVCCLQQPGAYAEAAETLRFYTQLPPDARPDAILCAYDTLALACVNTLQQAGLRVPEDIAVAGFDDSETALFSSPMLTSVHQPGREMGRESVRLLVELVRHERESGAQVILPCRVVARGSTDRGR